MALAPSPLHALLLYCWSAGGAKTAQTSKALTSSGIHAVRFRGAGPSKSETFPQHRGIIKRSLSRLFLTELNTSDAVHLTSRFSTPAEGKVR